MLTILSFLWRELFLFTLVRHLESSFGHEGVGSMVASNLINLHFIMYFTGNTEHLNPLHFMFT